MKILLNPQEQTPKRNHCVMDEQCFVGIDIGGTSSAVLLGNAKGEIIGRKQRPTSKGKAGWQPTVDFFLETTAEYMARKTVSAVGVSCGGPLDTANGLICSPPNLPGWDEVSIVDILADEFGLPITLENDANAGALAEWKYGAGQGCSNVIFLTFGTGLGAGLVLDGKLFAGSNGYGGEAGHIRLESDGPLGYNKRGSFEGFCSGSGLAQLMGVELLALKEQIGEKQMLNTYKEPGKLSGKDVVEWARREDPLALKVIQKSGEYLGKGLAILIDLLNPEVIIVGSMGVRLGELLLDPARKVADQEALPGARDSCKIVPAALEEKIGDLAALCVAMEAFK